MTEGVGHLVGLVGASTRDNKCQEHANIELGESLHEFTVLFVGRLPPQLHIRTAHRDIIDQDWPGLRARMPPEYSRIAWLCPFQHLLQKFHMHVVINA